MAFHDLLPTGSPNTANTKLSASSSYNKLAPSDTADPLSTLELELPNPYALPSCWAAQGQIL